MRRPLPVNGAVGVQVTEVQRGRILSAMFHVACEHGAANVTVGHVVERSGISRRTFYEHFSDRDACFMAAFEQALERASERVLPAYEAQGSWRERIRAGLVAFLTFLDDEPAQGCVLVRESLVAGRRVLAKRNELIAQLVRAVDEGRSETASSAAPPSLTAESVVGGVLTVIVTRLGEESGTPLVEQANQLMSMIVLPYLGAAAARRELGRPLPVRASSPGDDAGASVDPFKASGMRLTYRTLRVLMAVAEHSGASNRLIGQTAGITDQGQISKLLARLTRIGLVQNTDTCPGKGAPNNWVLTNPGWHVMSTIKAHSEGRTPSAGEEANK